MQPTDRDSYLAQQQQEIEAWHQKVDELVMTIEGKDVDPPQALRERVLDVSDRRDRVLEQLEEISSADEDDWHAHTEQVEAAWQDLREAWNRVALLLGKRDERV